MNADETSFSVAAVWLPFHRDLCGTLWEDDDLDSTVYRKNHDAVAAASALRYVYRLDWKGADAEDGVLATIKAARKFYQDTYLKPSQVKEMAQHFAVHYKDRTEPSEDYLDDHCGPVRWHWLNQHGRQEVEKAVRRSSEIWVTGVNVSDDVWVFTKPGRTT